MWPNTYGQAVGTPSIDFFCILGRNVDWNYNLFFLKRFQYRPDFDV